MSQRETRLLKIASLSFEAFNLRNRPMKKNKRSLLIFVLYFAGKDSHLALRLWSESMPLRNFNSQRPITFVTPHFEADSEQLFCDTDGGRNMIRRQE